MILSFQLSNVFRFVFMLSLTSMMPVVLQPAQAHTGISEGVARVTEQIQREPDSAQLYLKRGDLHRINQHWPLAIDDFQKAEARGADMVAVDYGIGLTYLDQQQAGIAIKYFDQILAVNPDEVRVLVNRAKANRLLEKPLAAALDYQQVIKINPLPDYYFLKAQAEDAAGSGYIDIAINTLDNGIAALGRLRVLEDYAILLERKRKNYDAALRRLDIIISRTSRIDNLLLQRGDIYYEAGRYKEAVSNYKAAKSAINKLPWSRRHTPMTEKMLLVIQRQVSALENNEGGY